MTTATEPKEPETRIAKAKRALAETREKLAALNVKRRAHLERDGFADAPMAAEARRLEARILAAEAELRELHRKDAEATDDALRPAFDRALREALRLAEKLDEALRLLETHRSPHGGPSWPAAGWHAMNRRFLAAAKAAGGKP